MRWLLLGSDGPMTAACLATVLATNPPPDAILLHGARWSAPRPWPRLPGPGTPTVGDLASRHHIPLGTTGSLRGPDLAGWLTDCAPAIAVTACFPRLIPLALLDLPGITWINLHPSPLPDYRGPDPLFFAARDGRTAWGVAAHLTDPGIDTGPILAREPCTLPADEPYPAWQAAAGSAMGRVLAQLLATGPDAWHPMAQGDGTYQSFPGAGDWSVDPAGWNADRLALFARCLEGWQHRLHLRLPGGGLASVLRVASPGDAAATTVTTADGTLHLVLGDPDPGAAG